MSILQEVQEAANKLTGSDKNIVNEASGCSMENEETSKRTKSKKPKVPDVVKRLKSKFSDPASVTATKVKNAIKAEFKNEAFSLEKAEWEKMSKDEQDAFVKKTVEHLKA